MKPKTYAIDSYHKTWKLIWWALRSKKLLVCSSFYHLPLHHRNRGLMIIARTCKVADVNIINTKTIIMAVAVMCPRQMTSSCKWRKFRLNTVWQRRKRDNDNDAYLARTRNSEEDFFGGTRRSHPLFLSQVYKKVISSICGSVHMIFVLSQKKVFSFNSLCNVTLRLPDCPPLLFHQQFTRLFLPVMLNTRPPSSSEKTWRLSLTL